MIVSLIHAEVPAYCGGTCGWIKKKSFAYAVIIAKCVCDSYCVFKDSHADLLAINLVHRKREKENAKILLGQATDTGRILFLPQELLVMVTYFGRFAVFHIHI